MLIKNLDFSYAPDELAYKQHITSRQSPPE